MGVVDPGRESRVLNLDSVLQSVRNLLSIGRQDRLFRFSGYNLEDLLFRLMVVSSGKRSAVEFLVRTTLRDVLSQDSRLLFDAGGVSVRVDPVRREVGIDLSFRVDGLGVDNFRVSLLYRPTAAAWRGA